MISQALPTSRLWHTTRVAGDQGHSAICVEIGKLFFGQLFRILWSGIRIWTKRFQNDAGEELKDWKAKGTEKLRELLRNKDLLEEEAEEP